LLNPATVLSKDDATRESLVDLCVAIWHVGIVMTLKYPWQRLYQEAALEFDKDKLADKIRLAAEAISARLQELSRVDGDAGSERQALANAMAGLQVLQRGRKG
jgi:hypothetical protein